MFGVSSFATIAPVDFLMRNMVNGLIQQASAKESGFSPRRLLFIFHPGGPCRWHFDLFLKPYSTTNFEPNFHMINKFVDVGGRYTDGEYKTTLIKGINAPYLWQFDIPQAGGGVRPTADLLDNMLAIQGIDVGSSGHDVAVRNNFNPFDADQSLMALSADASKAPMPAVFVGGHPSFIFKSTSKNTCVNAGIAKHNRSNMIKTIMDPFMRKSSSTFLQGRSDLERSIASATESLDLFAASENPGASAIAKSGKNARELLKHTFGDLEMVWNDLVAKYKDLIDRSVLVTLPGINDKPIGTTGSRNATYKGLPDVPDVRTVFSSYTEWFFAKYFAMAEFLLINNLTSSLTIEPGTLIFSGQDLYQDAHNQGRMLEVPGFTFYHRAYAACTLELIDQLKAKNMFNDTVVVNMSDFNRAPRKDGSGSDHARYSGSYTIWSGAVKGPEVVGNITTRPAASGAPGTWGNGDGTYNIGHWAATLAKMLRVPSPVTAASSLIDEKQGKFVSLIEKTKIV